MYSIRLFIYLLYILTLFGVGNAFGQHKSEGSSARKAPLTVIFLDHEFELFADQATDIKLVYDVAPLESVRQVAWEVLESTKVARHELSMLPRRFNKQKDFAIHLPHLAPGEYTVRLMVWNTDDSKSPPSAKDEASIKVSVRRQPFTIKMLKSAILARSDERIQLLSLPSPLNSVRRIAWELRDKDQKLLQIKYKDNTLTNNPSLFKPERIILPLENLAPGTYTATVKVWNTDDDKASEPATATAQIKVLNVQGGMAFIVGIDYYHDKALSYLSDDAKEFKKRLVELGYDEENIFTIYSTYKLEGTAFKNAKVDISENFGFTEDEQKEGIGKDNGGEYVTKNFLDLAFRKFVSAALERRAKHIVLFYGGHGFSGKDEGSQQELDLFLLPDGKRIWSTGWAQELFSNIDPGGEKGLTVIGFYDADRESASTVNVAQLADVNYFGFPSCIKGQRSWTDVQGSSLGLKHSFFGKALLDAMDDLKGQPENITVANLHAAISKRLKEIVDKAQSDPLYKGVQQSLPSADGITKRALDLKALPGKK